MAIVEGLIKPWAKHQSAETAAQIAKETLRGAELAKTQAVKNHLSKINGALNGNGNGNGLRNGVRLQKIKQPRFTQVVDEVIENPNDLGLEAARAVVVKRKFSGLTDRSLPLTDRIILLDEVDTLVKNRYRAKLDAYFQKHDNLIGHQSDPDVGTITVAGQEIRGKMNTDKKGVRSVKLKNKQKDIEEKLKRDHAQEVQTVTPDHKFTGGHHRIELDLGTAITYGLEEQYLKPFWKLVQNSYPNLFPGNHPYNQIPFERGFTKKLHAEVHRRLDAAGLDPTKVVNQLKGKTAGQKFAFMEKVSKILEEIDDFIAREMRKNRQRGVFS